MLAKIKKRLTQEYKDRKRILKKELEISQCEKEIIRRNVLMLCHSLEKGCGIKNVKKGYGKEKALSLIDNLFKLEGFNENGSFEYSEGIAVLKAYIHYKHDQHEDVDEIEKRFQTLNLKKANASYLGGYCLINKKEVLCGQNCDFEALVKSRHSLRAASNETIDRDVFIKAVALANHAPSACNRQPCKVYCSFDKTQNKFVGTLVPGNKAFVDELPYYCIVTAERDFFPGAETLQWYLNGGIYVAFLTLAFHSFGIGSCIFQWPDFYETEDILRQVAGIKSSEAIISIIGFGRYPDIAKYICAQRREPEQVINEF